MCFTCAVWMEIRVITEFKLRIWTGIGFVLKLCIKFKMKQNQCRLDLFLSKLKGC